MQASLRTLAAASVATAVLVAGCGSGGSASTGASGSTAPSAPAGSTTSSASQAPRDSATVTIKSFKYKPPTIVVKKGARVKFDNVDAAAHTATADDRSFDTQTIDQGKSKVVTFMTAGTIPYHCDFHPFMKGSIVVK